MQKINLRELYPDIYKTDTYLEVTDEVQAVFPTEIFNFPFLTINL